MKTIIHRAKDRGHADHGWLQANHSFSFANYFDKDKVQFGALRVLNDDTIAAKMGFGTHPHENMEIITIPLSGVLKHRDNINQDWQQVLSGEVQVMSAGTGVKHSEINGSVDEPLRLFQIWITPNQQNVAPRYDQKAFNPEDRENRLQILVTSIDDTHEGSLKIHQDAMLSRIDLAKDSSFKYHLKSEHHGVYVMLIEGGVIIADENLQRRDAVGILETDSFTIKATKSSEVLFIEIPV